MVNILEYPNRTLDEYLNPNRYNRERHTKDQLGWNDAYGLFDVCDECNFVDSSCLCIIYLFILIEYCLT